LALQATEHSVYKITNMKNTLISASLFAALVIPTVCAYEINNHADMSQFALQKSVLTQDFSASGKLFRLGLKQIDPTLSGQSFPLSAGLPIIRYCFGEYLPGQPAREYDRPANAAQRVQDGGVTQPNWDGSGAGGESLTIAQMIRYGACYEDAEEPFIRPRSHFYNPQNAGEGLSVIGIGAGPSSLDWMLKPGANIGGNVNHFSWQDARQAFYKALTNTAPDIYTVNPDTVRKRYWGLTFQALGHIMHHLQDMASPAHVRNDAHCNDPIKCASLLGSTLYRPSVYEYYLDQNFQFIRNLASIATTPIMFGLPREFWNMNTTDALATTGVPTSDTNQAGIAAYSSTNFISAGKT
jgi:hypothetical protein